MSSQSASTEYVPRRMHRKPRRVGRTVLLSVAMALVCVLAVGSTYADRLLTGLNSANHVNKADVLPSYSDQPTKDPGDESMNILLLGADKSQSGEKLSFTDKSGDQRSDSMMWVHIPADRSGVYIMSIMRDLWVDIPGHGEAKLNAAMQYGGVPLLAQTLESKLGAKIDHFVAVDFDGFRGLTNAIGGVKVNNPVDFCAYKSNPPTCYKKGTISVKGNRALRWVRERHAFVDGDYQRVRNQQQFLKAIFKKTLSPEVLSNPNKILNLAEQVLPYVTIDDELGDASYLAGLAGQMTSLRSGDIHSFTLPTAGTGTSSGGASIVLPDEGAIAEVGRGIKEGKMATVYKNLPEDSKK
ncbi:MAG: LCP family protein [Galactobacter sp.]|uniref:LCP family protein n=1 Tax=Galactobacter sp. TaxID=2676125 RepID=UPI0025C03BE7|nr:LCP family protein [Galactobacter sp.]